MKKIYLTLFIVLAFAFLSAIGDQNLVDQGWKAWSEGKTEGVSEAFDSASDNSEELRRATLSSIIFESITMEEFSDKTIANIKKLTKSDQFNNLENTSFFFNTNIKKKLFLKVMNKELKKSTDPYYSNKIRQSLIRKYSALGKFKDVRALLDEINYIKDWKTIGPFYNSSLSGMNETYPPETEYKPEQYYTGKHNAPVSWIDSNKKSLSAWIDFRDFYENGSDVFYANTYFYNPSAEKVNINFGSSGATKIFLNDEEIFYQPKERDTFADVFILTGTMPTGWNKILVKVGFADKNSCNFQISITDTMGNPLEGSNVTPDAMPYTSGTSEWVLQDNKIINYYQELIKQNPDHLENYYFLCKEYIFEDNSDAAERLIDSVEVIYPNPLFWDYLKWRVYLSSDKDNKINQHINKLINSYEDIYFIDAMNVAQKLEEENHEKVKQLLEEFKSKYGENKSYNKDLLMYYHLTDNTSELIKLIDSALIAQPDDIFFLELKANLLAEQKNYSAALKTINKALKYSCTNRLLDLKSSCIIAQGNYLLWEKNEILILEKNEYSISSLKSLINDYILLEEYDSASNYFNIAKELNPNRDDLAKLGGEIASFKHDKSASEKYYRASLRMWPLDYKLKRIHSELINAPDVFAEISAIDPLDLLDENVNLETYPDEQAVILRHRVDAVLYKDGGAEYNEISLYKLLTEDAVDTFKNFNFNRSFKYGKFYILEVKIIKPNGDVKSAEINGSNVLLTDIEKGDYVFMKSRNEYYYAYLFMGEFWETFTLNSVYPTIDSKLRMVLPKDYNLSILQQNLDITPQVTQYDDGSEYIWEMANDPGIEIESNMPSIGELTSKIVVSSLKSWEDIVTWYDKVTANKHCVDYDVEKLSDQLFEGKADLTDLEKVETIYNYITEEIEYISSYFYQDGLIPRNAYEVINSKVGDCKDVSTLGKALLKTIGIDSYYVLVNTTNENPENNFLPATSVFNHAILAVELEGDLHYIDLTAQNHPMSVLPLADRNAPSLLIKHGVNKLFNLPKATEIPNLISTNKQITIDSNRNINAETEDIYEGLGVVILKSIFRSLSDNKRDKLFNESLSSKYNDVTLLNLEFDNLDSLATKLSYRMSYTADDYVHRISNYSIIDIPLETQLDNSSITSYSERKTPIYIPNDYSVYEENITISFPNNYSLVALPKDIIIDNEFVNYQLNFSKIGKKVKLTKSMQFKRSWIPVDEYNVYNKLYKSLIKSDSQKLLFKVN